jgi:hypothetical protein
MSLASDQDAKRTKRATAHAIHVANVATPATAVATVETDPPAVVPVALQAGNSYPSPPF